jgi:hypothetical protein
MPEEVKELPGGTASGAGEAGFYGFSMVDRNSPVFSIKQTESPPFPPDWSFPLKDITPFGLVNLLLY